MSKKRHLIAKVGNFEITKGSGPEHDYIHINSIDGHWRITHRDDSEMYGKWMSMLKDPEYRKGVEVRIIMEYTMSHMLYDEGFLRDWWKAIEEYTKRKIAAAPVPTEQEVAEAIAEAEMMAEMNKMAE